MRESNRRNGQITVKETLEDCQSEQAGVTYVHARVKSSEQASHSEGNRDDCRSEQAGMTYVPARVESSERAIRVKEIAEDVRVSKLG